MQVPGKESLAWDGGGAPERMAAWVSGREPADLRRVRRGHSWLGLATWRPGDLESPRGQDRYAEWKELSKRRQQCQRRAGRTGQSGKLRRVGEGLRRPRLLVRVLVHQLTQRVSALSASGSSRRNPQGFGLEGWRASHP